jgi:hypothetical protein
MSKREELNNKFFMGGLQDNYGTSKSGLILPGQPLQKEIEGAKTTKEVEEANSIYKEAALAKQKKLEEKLQRLEIMPVANRIIILPYPHNPYKQEVTAGGILVDYEGQFLNPDTGTQDKLQPTTSCAEVIEVGPDVVFVRPGDDVFYPTQSTLPVPFMNRGFLQISEPQVLAVINEGLTDRFKEIKKK